MKWIAGLFLLLICGMPYLAADDFEDLIHACARASENYNRAIRSESRSKPSRELLPRKIFCRLRFSSAVSCCAFIAV